MGVEYLVDFGTDVVNFRTMYGTQVTRLGPGECWVPEAIIKAGAGYFQQTRFKLLDKRVIPDTSPQEPAPAEPPAAPAEPSVPNPDAQQPPPPPAPPAPPEGAGGPDAEGADNGGKPKVTRTK